MVKERFEILVEELKKDFRGAFDGISALRSEMHQMEDRLTQKIDENTSAIKFVANKVNSIDKKIDAHISLPAHT